MNSPKMFGEHLFSNFRIKLNNSDVVENEQKISLNSEFYFNWCCSLLDIKGRHCPNGPKSNLIFIVKC